MHATDVAPVPGDAPARPRPRRTPRLLASVASVAALGLGATQAQAQFSGAPAYTVAPWSQIGPNTGSSNLTVTNTANGFTVAGTFTVTTPPGSATGILAGWTLDRPIAAGVNNPSFQTTSAIDGFVAPPVGAFQPTSGTLVTYVTDTSVPGTLVAGSQAVIALSLINGATTWPTLSVNSAPFALVTGTSTTFVLRQTFFLDGVQLAGPGGSWVVDVPITSSLAPVPEPAAAWLLAAGLAGLGWRRGLRAVAGRARA